MRVINCDDALVIASVSENTYEGLRIGQRAVFQPRDGSPPMSGSIAVLNGLGAVAANGAVPQSALSREPYHVTVKFPDIAKTGDCRISQAGLVTFQGAEGSVAADVKAWVLR